MGELTEACLATVPSEHLVIVIQYSLSGADISNASYLCAINLCLDEMLLLNIYHKIVRHKSIPERIFY